MYKVLIDDIVKSIDISRKDYIGNIYNKKQFDFIRSKTDVGRIIVIGDLLNDYMLPMNRRIWSLSEKDIPVPKFDRSITLYYKNEPPYKKTVDQDDFFAFYSITKKLIELGSFSSFNNVRIICKHSIPTYYDSLDCEKICDDIGPKKFEEYLNIYSNPVFITTATANHYLFGSKGIVSRNVYEKKSMDRTNSILFNYVYCPIKQNNVYDDEEEFIWMDDMKSTYNGRFHEFLSSSTKIGIRDKLIDFVNCLFELDKNPLTNNI